MTTRAVKRAFKYRFYPTDAQAAELARTEPLNIAWSRPLPDGASPSTVTVSQDAAGRWFPWSKLCSTCGALTQWMPLNVRSWTCPCGVVNDRDVNAARNILAEGLSVIACGGGVRPQREYSWRGSRR